MSETPRPSGDAAEPAEIATSVRRDRNGCLPFVFAEGEVEVHRFLEQVIGEDEQSELDGPPDSPPAR